jgi:uncharacterized GH25 family protein
MILVFVMLFPAASLAHDTWLLAESAITQPGTTVALDLTSGMEFPALDHAIEVDRIDRALYRLAGKTLTLKDRESQAGSLRFSAHLLDRGVASLWVALKPRAIELTHEQVGHYLEEIGAAEEIRREWAAAEESKRWTEIYEKHAKTFVRVGEVGQDESWAEPVGMALEFVPQKDPTTLVVGDELAVRLLEEGRPVPNVQVGIVHEGNAQSEVRRTDAEGRTSIRLHRPGRWLLRATVLRKSANNEMDWKSDFATLTFEVQSQ